MLNEHIISFRRFFYRKYIYKRRNMLRRAIFMMTTLCALPVMAQQTNETGYMAEISRADLADANGQRLDEIGAVLQRDRDNVHSGVAKDTGELVPGKKRINMAEIEREAMEYDVVIVGAGPAGLSAAIRLKQLNADCNVVVLEKGSEVGAHILSGAVLDPAGIDQLIPDWKEKGAPITVPVKEDNFYMLGEAGKIRLPNFGMPPLMNNHGNYIVSMGNVCRWMAEQAEGLGIEIFPGMACSELGNCTANMCSCPKACAVRSPNRSSRNTTSRRMRMFRNTASA